MVHIVLTGATGMVGSAVLHHIQSLPASNPITKLTILSRSPVPQASAPSSSNTSTKIAVINHQDYLSYPSNLVSQLYDAKAIIWAQGVSQTEVSSEAEYTKITKDFPLAAANAFATGTKPEARGGKPLNFVYVSGEGATHSPGLFTQMFGRIKGETELALIKLAKETEHRDRLAVYNPRPGGVVPEDSEVFAKTMAKRPATLRWLIKLTLPVVKVAVPGMLVNTPDLGKVLVDMALKDGEPYDEGPGIETEGRVIRNTAIRRLAGL